MCWRENNQGAFSESEFSPGDGRTILQGVRDLLDGSLEAGDDERLSPGAGGKEHPRREDLPAVEVVYKKGIRVDGSNDLDRDDALSEVSQNVIILL